MADVFLSHASADVELAERVAELLGGAGYDVWWDQYLLSGERFQVTIERELAGATVVLVLWTEASVGSEWVYAEAQRGSRRTALVQVRTRLVGVDELPAPFNGRHCPYVDDDEAVLAAVAAHAAPGGAVAGRVRNRTLVHREPGGVEVFDSAAEAVEAALTALTAVPTVGVGVHTGTPTAYEDGWIGMDATRAARVASAAAPGQVLLTEATAALVRDLAGVRTRDLGSHTFRELAHPEHLHQAERPGQVRSFPPIRSLGSAAGLPRPATAFLGRAEDVEEVTAALTEGAAALVTVVGPGGIGKTRLAIAAAARVASGFDGVYFVPLETVTDAEGMWAATGAALGLPEEEQSEAGVIHDVGHRRLLLVLDNLEQLPDAGQVVTELLATCPETRVLATSRGPLHAHGEQELALGPLDLETDALDLFVRQAQLVRRGFALDDSNRDDVLEICRSLDCLPLALSLAAARLRLLPPRALRDRLGDVLDVADKSHQDRHRTLRTTLEWSYGLLDVEQRALLRRLSVFPAGARLDAVEELDVLAALAEASIVEVRDEVGEPRVHLLNTTRAFALEQLVNAGEQDAAYTVLARWLRSLVEEPSRWTAPSYAAWAKRAGIPEELDNIRAALVWLVDDHSGRPDIAQVDETVALASAYFVHTSVARLDDARNWLEAAVTTPGGTASTTRVNGCLDLAWALSRVDPEKTHRLMIQARDLWMALSAEDRADVRGRQTEALIGELDAVALWRDGDLAGARAVLDRLLATDLPDQVELKLKVTLSILVAAAGDPERALALEREASALARAAGDLAQALILEVNVGCSLRELGRPEEALIQMNQFIPLLLAESPHPQQVPIMAEDYFGVLVDVGEVEHAALLWGAVEGSRERLGVPRGDSQVAETAAPLAAGRERLGSRWDELVAEGRSREVEQLLLETVAATAG